MSKRLISVVQPATQCSSYQVRNRAPRAYLFRNDDTPQSRRSHVYRPNARSFSTTPSRCAGSVRQISPSQQSRPSEPSMSAQIERMKKEQLRSGKFPEEFGILPDTFIMPYENKRPSWLRNRAARLKLEKERWKTRLYELGR